MLSFILRSTSSRQFSIAAATLAAVSGESHAQTGSVRPHVVKAGFIVGLGGGRGILIYHGRRYPLRIGGIGVGSLGIVRWTG